MDELKLILGTKFMRSIVTKIIAKAIFKKTGYHVGIDLHEITAETVNGKVHLHMNVGAVINTDDLVNIIKPNDLT